MLPDFRVAFAVMGLSKNANGANLITWGLVSLLTGDTL